MKTALSIISCLLCIVSLVAQEYTVEPPDYKEISKNITRQKSQFYYPVLLDRYQNHDTTLTLDEKRHLYYGYSFQEDYSPYGRSEYSDSLKVYYELDTLTENDYQNFIRLSLLLLDDNPFDLRTMIGLSYAYYSLDQLDLFQRYSYKSNVIFDSIMSSGDGLSAESAFHVIDISHEYELLYYLGLDFGGRQSLTHMGQDYLQVTENEYGIEGLYFDVSRCLLSLDAMLKK